MRLAEEIEKLNAGFISDSRKAVLKFVNDALELGHDFLEADKVSQAVFCIGRHDAEKVKTNRDIARCYSTKMVNRVCNFYYFFNYTYHSYLERTGLLYYDKQGELDYLKDQLEKKKKEVFDPLSMTMAIKLDTIMETDKSVIDAKSIRDLDKKSFTKVRNVSNQDKETKEKLKQLGQKSGLPAELMYNSLQELRMKIRAHERRREDKLRQGRMEVLRYINAFLDQITESLQSMVTLGYGNLPQVHDVDDIEVADKKKLSELFYSILAADKTIFPHERVEKTTLNWPMPRVVLVPVIGYISSPVGLSSEKFKDNVIFCPTRCLEDYAEGFAREVLRLKKRINHRREALVQEAYRDFIRKHSLLGGSYDEMYEKFLRFCTGDQSFIRRLGEGERRIILEHFLPDYTSLFYIPPEIWPRISRLSAGATDSRADFNDAIEIYKEDKFLCGVLHADRAWKYHLFMEQSKSDPSCGEETMKRYAESRESHREAASKNFRASYKEGLHTRFSVFNLAVLLLRVPPQKEEQRHADLELSIKLFRESKKDDVCDLWTYMADTHSEECRRRLTPGGDKDDAGEGQLTPNAEKTAVQEGVEKSRPDDSAFFSWVKDKFRKK